MTVLINPKKNPLIFGTLLLSFSGLFCRGIGFFYRLFVAQAFGEEAMGIFQLITPVLMMGYSLTTAGMQTAISRFVAYACQKKEHTLCRFYLLGGSAFCFLLALGYSILIYGQAEFISLTFLQEKRCTPLLKILAFSFPLSALHGCFNGYYYGKKETVVPAFSQIIEQLTRCTSIILLYYYSLSRGITPTILLTCFGALIGEGASFLTLLFFYFKWEKPSIFHSFAHFSILPMVTFSIPLTFNRVMVNILHSLESVSIPQALKQFGYSTSASLSIYGVFTGMALSLIFFSSTFTNSASVLLLPTVSEAAGENNKIKIRSTLYKTIGTSLFLGLIFGSFFFFLAPLLGNLLFHSMLAGIFIRRLSFLCPFLYLHTTLSSILNGLKRSSLTLLINVTELLIRLFFVMFLIPRYGINSYLYGLILSELISSFLCLFFLRKYLS